jgi:hypothetical protein
VLISPIPEAHFVPAARRSAPDRVTPCSVLRVLRALGSGALATGVLVAILAAVLRIWFRLIQPCRSKPAHGVLRALADASLIDRVPGNRYGMHDLVRAYATDTAH